MINKDLFVHSSVWMYFGLIGAFLFILIQLVLLVDFAHSWNSSWVEKMEETGSKVWAGLLLFFTFLMYGTAVAGIVCLYIYFTHGQEGAPEKKCHTNKFFISFNLILCIVASFLAIHPKIQEHQPRSGRCFNTTQLSIFNYVFDYQDHQLSNHLKKPLFLREHPSENHAVLKYESTSTLSDFVEILSRAT